MTYELNRKQFAKALKKAKKRGQCKMSTVKDSLGLAQVGEPRDLTSPNKFPVTHNLSLRSLTVDDVPKDILFPEELNQYLRKQIQELTAANGRLQRELEEKEADLRLCINQNEQLLSSEPSPLIGLGRASELAASKIVELSKRVRELTAEYEGAKARWRTAERKLKGYEQGGEAIEAQQKELGADQEENLEPNGNDLKTLTEKLNATMTKLCESRNQNQQLKQELKMANKVLASEIGESVSVQSVTSAASNWRGRAQQILSLQQKVVSLQDKLKEQNGEEKLPAKISGAAVVRQMEKDRQAANEQVAKELGEKTQQLEDTRRKLEATRARCRIWESENERKKKTIEHYAQMDQHDKELIKTLSAELDGLEKRQAERTKKESKKVAEWEEKYKEANEIYMRERSKNEQLEMIIRQKEEKIQKFKALEDTNTDDDRHRRHSAAPSLYEGGGSEGSAGDRTVLLAAEAERIRLLELVAVLNHRLDEQRARWADSADALRRERAKGARLEAKVGRLEMERHGLIPTRGAPRPSGPDNNTTTQRYKLELMEEELLATRQRLDCVIQEKEVDLKMYRNAFDEAQRVFLEGSRQGSSCATRSVFGTP